MSEHDVPGLATSAATPVLASMFKRAAWARILPFLTYICIIVAADLLERLGWSAAELRWLYGARIGAVALLLAICWRRYAERKTFPLPAPAIALALATGVLALWVSLDASWMIIGSPTGFDPSTSGRIDWPLVALRIAGAALVVPVMEELFWRSFLLRWIVAADFESVDPSQVRPRSFILTSLLFGFEHTLWLAGIVAGLAYSALYMRHRTLWSPILAHAVTNGLLGVWVVSTASWTYW